MADFENSRILTPADAVSAPQKRRRNVDNDSDTDDEILFGDMVIYDDGSSPSEEDYNNRKKPKTRSAPKNVGLLDSKTVSSLLSAITQVETTSAASSGLFARVGGWIRGGANNSVPSERGMTLTILGQTSHGKSSVLRGLLDIEDTVPTGEDPVTMYPVKLCIVKPDPNNPCKYRVTFKGESRQFATAEETRNYFNVLFKQRKGFPSYDEIIVLEIADSHALQLVTFDTPGPRTGVKTESWVKLAKQVDGRAYPYVIVVVRYGDDICSDSTLQGICNAFQEEMSKLKLLVVINQMDRFPVGNPRAAGAFVNQIAKLQEDFAGAKLDIALVQAMDALNREAENSHHRAVEMDTLSKLPTSVTSLAGVMLGVDATRDFILRTYIKSYDSTTLVNLKNDLEKQLQEKKKDFALKSKATKCKEERDEVNRCLEKRSVWATKVEVVCASALRDSITQISAETDLSIPRVPTLPEENRRSPVARRSVMGPVSDEDAEARLRTINNALKSIFASLSDQLPAFVDTSISIHKQFVQFQLQSWQRSCPQFVQLVLDFWEQYTARVKDQLVSSMQTWSKICSTLPVAEPQPGDNLFVLGPDCKFSLLDPVGKVVSQRLGVLLNNWVFHYAAYFHEIHFMGFQAELAEHLASSDVQWNGASAEDLAGLNYEIQEIEKSCKALEKAISDLSHLKTNGTR